MIKVNLIPPELQKRVVGGFNYLYLFIIPAVVAIGLVPLYASKLQELKKLEKEIVDINQKIEQHKGIQEELARAHSDINLIQSKISFIEEKKKKQLFWNKALDKITAILPSNVWLDSLSLTSAGGVSISGNTFSFDDVSKFITILNRSSTFSGARLGSTSKSYGGEILGRDKVTFSLTFNYKETEK